MSCIICNRNLSVERTYVCKSNAIKTLIASSLSRKDNLHEVFGHLESLTVHTRCRRSYNSYRETDDGKRIMLVLPHLRPKPVEKDVPQFEEPSALSYLVGQKVKLNEKTEDDAEIDPSKPFPFGHRCFICAKELDPRKIIHKLSKPSAQERFMRLLKSLPLPRFQTILRRVENVDLIAKEARYHRRCMYDLNEFHIKYFRKTTFRSERVAERHKALEIVFTYMEKSIHSEFTMTELYNLIKDFNHKPKRDTIKRYIKNKYAYKVKINGSIITLRKSGSFNNAKSCQKMATQNKAAFPTSTSTFKAKCSLNGMDHDPSLETQQLMEMDDGGRDDYDDEITEQDEIKTNTLITIKTEPKQKLVKEVNIAQIIKEKEELKPFCRVCLSSDRKLYDLGEYQDIYKKICADLCWNEPKLLLLCWECRSLLKNAKRFYDRAQKAQELLSQLAYVKGSFTSLSSLSKTTPDTLKVSYKPGKVKKQESEGEKIEKIEEIVIPEPKMAEHQIEIDHNWSQQNFLKDDGDKQDIHSNIDVYENAQEEELQERTVPTNTVFDDVNEDENHMDDDDDEDLDDGFNDKDSDCDRAPKDDKKPRRSVKKVERFGEFWDKPLPFTFDVPKDYRKKKKTDNTSDDEWLEEKNQRNVEENQKYRKITHYQTIYRSFNADEKIQRDPIEPSEVDSWLENERNSAFFYTQTSKCDKCVSKIEGEDHYKIYHSPENPHSCPVCYRTFRSAAERSAHLPTHYYSLSCTICWYSCYNEDHMRYHLEGHRTAVLCVSCDFPFRKHMLQVCTVCHKSYKSYNQLQNHMKIRHYVNRTEAAYCVECDKQFNNESLFKHHLTHAKIHRLGRTPPSKLDPKKPKNYRKKRVECPECHGIFAGNYNMRCHYDMVHLKQTKYQCHICDKMMSCATNLKKHLDRHAGIMPPKDKFCQYCGRGFSKNTVLIHHVRTHTGERPNKCPHCDASFAQKIAMVTHVKKKHGNLSSTT